MLALLLAAGPKLFAADTDPLVALKPTHPRLLLPTEHRWSEIQAQAETDPLLAQYISQLLLEAEPLLDEPLLERRKQGRRMLSVSREAFRRITLWSMARHMLDDPRYARRASAEMQQLAGFSDWNPSHFLDVAEMTAALAIGYDWLHQDLDPAARKIIREGIIRHGLEPGVDAIRRGAWWATKHNNWNQVCFGGLTLGALAVADEAPAIARELLQAARSGISYGLAVYAPDGVYPEGPGYWGYGTVYQCLMIDALRTALGSSWQLEDAPGFLQSARTQVQLAGPTGSFFNFGDGHAGPSLQPPLFWFASELNAPALLHSQRRILAQKLEQPSPAKQLSVLPLLWWPEVPARPGPPELPLAWQGAGTHPVAVFRSCWTDPNALYLAVKGGRVDHGHAHLDSGSFVLEAGGVRWAVDLGMQNYHSLESKGLSLWNTAQEADRWKVFRYNNRSHNTLTIDDQLHRVDGVVEFTRFDPENAVAELDLSPVFANQAEQVTRHFKVTGHQLTVSDHLQGLKSGASVRWTMATQAAVEIKDNQASLRQNGRKLLVTLRQPGAATIQVIPADPPDDGFNAPNPGTSLLIVDAVAPASGALCFEVHFNAEEMLERAQTSATTQ